MIEPSASPLPGLNVKLRDIRSYTYWYLPLPIVVEAAWFRVMGFNVLTMRLFPAMWAIVLLGAWFIAIQRLSGNAWVAALAVVFTAADPVFLERSGFGRFDLMRCALGFCGIAAYLELRERSLPKALLLGNALVVAAGMTHPTGGLLSLPGLACLVFYFDRRRLAMGAPAGGRPAVSGGGGRHGAVYLAGFCGFQGSVFRHHRQPPRWRPVRRSRCSAAGCNATLKRMAGTRMEPRSAA